MEVQHGRMCRAGCGSDAKLVGFAGVRTTISETHVSGQGLLLAEAAL
jgi:hypothetical protein